MLACQLSKFFPFAWSKYKEGINDSLRIVDNMLHEKLPLSRPTNRLLITLLSSLARRTSFQVAIDTAAHTCVIQFAAGISRPSREHYLFFVPDGR